MIIYNAFSKTPTRNFTAAGIDFFIPSVNEDDEEKKRVAIEAFKSSYKINDYDIEAFDGEMMRRLLYKPDVELSNYKKNKTNALHLFYALKSKKMHDLGVNKTLRAMVDIFVSEYLVYDKDGNIGIKMQFSDMLLINSGIKVALDEHTSLEFKNKSGKGNSGWSVKACLVDEDYSGYVHLSMQYLWWDGAAVYVGDKLTQGTVQHVMTTDAEEVSREKYDEIMSSSHRGSNGFGSSDVKH